MFVQGAELALGKVVVEAKGKAEETKIRIKGAAMPNLFADKTAKIAQMKFGFPKKEGQSLVGYIYQFILFMFIKLKGMLKFAIVGGIGALLGFTMIYTLTEWAHFHYLVSTIIACVSTTTVCYTLNHLWTFGRAKIRHGWFAGWVKYEITDGVFNALVVGEMALFTEVFGFWYMASAVLAVAINYPIRYLLFRRYIWDMKSLEKEKAK